MVFSRNLSLAKKDTIGKGISKESESCNFDCVYVLIQLYLFITVQQICMKIVVDLTPNSGCLTLVLCHWSSFGFGVENVLVSRFVSPFKCTVNTKLQKLITPHWKVLCD